jgi:hypothetical protein
MTHQVLWGDHTIWRDTCRLDHNQTEASGSKGSQMDEMPIGRDTSSRFCRVLTHLHINFSSVSRVKRALTTGFIIIQVRSRFYS